LTEFLGIQIEIFAGVVIPAASAAAVVIWRTIVFFHNKELCFQLLKNKVEGLKGEAQDGHETHKDLYDKVDMIERNLMLVMGHLGIEPVTE
jgi:hypothetical protein